MENVTPVALHRSGDLARGAGDTARSDTPFSDLSVFVVRRQGRNEAARFGRPDGSA